MLRDRPNRLYGDLQGFYKSVAFVARIDKGAVRDDKTGLGC